MADLRQIACQVYEALLTDCEKELALYKRLVTEVTDGEMGFGSVEDVRQYLLAELTTI